MYTQITYQDRLTIEIQLKRGTNQREIALILNKNPGTISREIKRNSVKKKGSKEKVYLANEGELKAYQRCWRSKMQSMKINMNTEMKNFIIEQIQKKDIIPSPKIIAFLWNNSQKEKKNHITHTSIYSWLETSDGNKFKEFLLYKYKGYKKVKACKGSKIIGRIGIEERGNYLKSVDYKKLAFKTKNNILSKSILFF